MNESGKLLLVREHPRKSRLTRRLLRRDSESEAAGRRWCHLSICHFGPLATLPEPRSPAVERPDTARIRGSASCGSYQNMKHSSPFQFQTSQVSTLGLVTVRLSDQKGGGNAVPLSCNLPVRIRRAAPFFPGSRSVYILAAQRSLCPRASPCRLVWLQLLSAGEGAQVRPAVCPVLPFSARLQVLAQPRVAAYRHGCASCESYLDASLVSVEFFPRGARGLRHAAVFAYTWEWRLGALTDRRNPARCFVAELKGTE